MIFRLKFQSQFLFFAKNIVRNFHESNAFQKADLKNILQDANYTAMFPEIKQSVKSFQNVLAIQPDSKSERSHTTTAQLEASELCALVESIPLWRVAEQIVQPLKRIDKHKVFGSGKLEELTSHIKQHRRTEPFTAVVLGLNKLSSNQLTCLQNLWGVPVYDRFSVILEIFRARAKTNEAKMQVALAEISYLKSNLYTLHHGGAMEHQREALEKLGGSGETYISTRRHLLREREARIEKEVAKIASQKEMFRSSRKKVDLPVIAVVGYTNAGKTSLIRCLTGDSNLIPEDRLFATLDVTAFTGYLSNNTKVLYLDTIGFISKIPPSLFAAFSASLQDIVHADLLMVISDCSHPDKTTQDNVVMETLKNILRRHHRTSDSPSEPSTDSLLQNIVFVHNKSDLLNEDERTSLKSSIKSSNEALISLREGWGLSDLLGVVQENLMRMTQRVTRRLRVPIKGSILPWLYKEAVVESVSSDPADSEKYLLEVTMSPVVDAKFCNMFKPKK